MTFHAHFLLMAKYNQRLNNQMIEACYSLDRNILTEDKGAFFISILGTLNHILVGDFIWLKRFSAHSQRYKTLIDLTARTQPKTLNEVLYERLDSFKAAREEVDSAIITWLSEEVMEGDFCQTLEYANTKDIKSERNFAELVSHLFNHQTHHRGQASNLLYQEGVDIGVTDFLIEIPDILK